jgi:hypothetical protein
MIGLLCFVVAVLASPFRSKIRLEVENAALRHQLVVLRCKLKGRPRVTRNDRWFFVQLYRWFPPILPVLMIMRPETLVRWHRAGFRRDWRWKSRRRGGRPPIESELRALVRQMSTENSLWGAPRIHGGLLKLGFDRFVGAGKQRRRDDRMRRRLPPSARPSVMSAAIFETGSKATTTPVAPAVPRVFAFSVQAAQSIVVDPKSFDGIYSPHGLILSTAYASYARAAAAS